MINPVPQPEERTRIWLWFAAVGALLVANVIVFALQNAVNLPFADQWALQQAIWRHPSTWELIDHQNGPHRQGVFFPLTACLLKWTHGDTRCESLFIAVWLSLAGVLAFLLPKRITGRWHCSDVLPAAWCLSLTQYETITTTPNLSHSIGPLVLLLLVAHALLVVTPWLRWTLVSVLGLALTFTGFGMFGAVWLIAYAGWVALKSRGVTPQWPAVAAVVVMAAGWAVFLSNYHFDPAARDFAFPHWPLWHYGRFLALMFATPCGFGSATVGAGLVGGALFAAGGFAMVWVARRLYRRTATTKLDSVSGLLLATSLLYAINTAIGRVQLGAAAAMPSRYVSLEVPLLIALFLLVRTWTNPTFRCTGLIAFSLLALWPYNDILASGSRFGTWGLPRETLSTATMTRNGKLAWLWRYSKTHDVADATRVARIDLYVPGEYAMLTELVGQLRAINWGPFRDGVEPSDYYQLAGPPDIVFVGFHDDDNRSSWLTAEGWLVVHTGSRSWLNVEVRNRLFLLPGNAPLVIEFADRRGEFRNVGLNQGLSLPLVGDGEWVVVHLSSPEGARRPVEGGTSTDDRDMSFQFGRVTIDKTPRYNVWGPIGEHGWSPVCAIDELRGFHGWEKGFGWMDATLDVTVETSSPAWLNARIDGRFPGLHGTGGLHVSVDGKGKCVVPLHDRKGSFSVAITSPGRHVVSLGSEDGATSPLACGLSQDSRNLSYRFFADFSGIRCA